jgi:predicted transcriptional regulator
VNVVERQEKRKRHREQHRDNYEIVSDILQCIASKYDCNISEVTFGASLTYYQQKRYFSLLKLEKISSESNYCNGYEISILGRRYLEVFADIKDDLGYDTFGKWVGNRNKGELNCSIILTSTFEAILV